MATRPVSKLSVAQAGSHSIINMKITEVIFNAFDLVPATGAVKSTQTEYSNSPDEHTADIDAVFASGNDVHRSKHPADIRGDSVSMYPNHQHKP